ncbi:MAG: acyltransferase family protein [Reinekea sp.]|jgi:glucans biosynthesis protein C
MLQRLDFADNIRTVLICQVIMVHAAVTYGGEGGWYFREPTDSLATVVSLTLFNALSQSFFMSLLFLLAGFFTQHSLQRTAVARYWLTRLKRLGLPLLAYYLGVGPLTAWLALQLEGGGDFHYLRSLHAGPMWFAQALLIFTGLFLLIRPLFKPSHNLQRIPFSWYSIMLFALVLWLVSIPARACWPMGEGIAGMQLGSFGHYSLMYLVGILAARSRWSDWLQNVPMKPLYLLVSLGCAVLPVGMMLGVDPESGFEPFMGGLSWQALFYEGWESMMCVLLSVLVLNRFLQTQRMQQPVWRQMGRANYGVYFLHPPLLLFASMLLIGIDLPPIIKFFAASAITIGMSFPLAWGLTRLPVIRDIF